MKRFCLSLFKSHSDFTLSSRSTHVYPTNLFERQVSIDRYGNEPFTDTRSNLGLLFVELQTLLALSEKPKND